MAELDASSWCSVLLTIGNELNDYGYIDDSAQVTLNALGLKCYTPEQKLWLRVFAQAVAEAATTNNDNNSKRRKEAAFEWLRSSSEEVTSARWVCDVLKITIRERIIKVLEEGTHKINFAGSSYGQQIK